MMRLLAYSLRHDPHGFRSLCIGMGVVLVQVFFITVKLPIVSAMMLLGAGSTRYLSLQSLKPKPLKSQSLGRKNLVQTIVQPKKEDGVFEARFNPGLKRGEQRSLLPVLNYLAYGMLFLFVSGSQIASLSASGSFDITSLENFRSTFFIWCDIACGGLLLWTIHRYLNCFSR